MPRTKLYFLHRIPEPKRMGELELKVFEEESKKNYQQWIVPVADEALKISKLRSGKIIDVGCGPGLLVREFSLRSGELEVVGIDSSQHAIKQSIRNCKGLTNIKFKKANALHIPFGNNSFNLVVCKDSLHHFGNLKKVLLEMYRITKRGGVIYIQDLRRDLPWYLLKMVIPPKTPFQELQFYSARAAYTKTELKNVLNKLALQSYSIKTKLITDEIKKKYKKTDVDIAKLKISFQTRYVLIIKKK